MAKYELGLQVEMWYGDLSEGYIKSQWIHANRGSQDDS
jgi:hypothetical protein